MTKCKFCKTLVVHNNIFCSKSCAAKFNNKNTRRHGCEPVQIQCLFCSKLFSVEYNRSHNRKYCSNACQGKYTQHLTDKKIEKGEKVSSHRVKRYLVNKYGHFCVICKQTEWMKRPIPLVLDHINGNPTDNNLTNLRLICANCDHQTDTFAGKNKNNPSGGRKNRMKRYKDGKSY